ncbi:MAG: aspartate aminotransferase family protein [Rhodospirillales bacterium]|nr:MAG: aspartate aminotransferase family protein [Rhodospirillales bacterium]
MTESSQAEIGRNYDAEALIADDLAHHLHPFTDYKALAEEGGGRVITHADGVYLWDANGQRYLDGMAGLWCVNVGYGRRELVSAAAEQMLELPFYNTFFKTTTPPAAELSALLSDLTPASFNHVFFANSGSEANDTILRMARHFWHLEGKPEKRVIISRHNAYHGSTTAALSLGGMEAMHGQGGIIPDIVHVAQPYWYGEGGDTDPEAFGLTAARAIEEKILELGADRIAAFIGEPIQGAGGVIIPPDSYWPEVQRICRKYDILLICDEVICGFGRTGNWFGFETFGIESADFITMAKGLSSGYLPISAAVVGDRVANTLIDKGGEFFHGFTYSGHPAACAVAIKNIEIIRREGLVERCRDETGPHLAKALKTLEDHPLVGETRSRGLIGAIELVADKAARKHFDAPGKVGTICRDHCINSGLIMRAVRDIMVLSPPLVITTQQIDEMIAMARKAIDATAKDIGVM